MQKLKPLAFLLVILIAILTFTLFSDKKSNIDNIHETDADLETLTEEVETNTFEELGISMQVPGELVVIKEPVISEETGELESYIFYVQNYGYEGGPETGDFQLYGSYQFRLPTVQLRDLEAMKEDTQTYEYVKDFVAGDLTGYESQYKGERNNYVYSLLLYEQVLRISVSEPTAENKELAESILKSIKLN